jgi:hypothetical protein
MKHECEKIHYNSKNWIVAIFELLLNFKESKLHSILVQIQKKVHWR